ncbi:ACT domain-containing protein [Nocardia farcinica]|uniref:ACT domain-containing protein n=1 Tax=Nocardia farcinica TaxID=37329 RepID=UPI001894EFC0|nr:ACT domain-containing protein [Nocardia farcinica]MBF6522050.1 amino acid-binding protein [Nocardia farcinica]
MWPTSARSRLHALACEVCGRLPHPPRTRLALAKLAAVFPVELCLHAVVIHLHPPYLLTVLTLTVTTTVLVIWVVEPSAMRLLGRWLHGPQLRVRDAVGRAPALWRVRVRLDDRPGRLEALTARLADHAVNILAVHVHRLESGVLDELVVSAPDGLTAQALTGAVRQAGGAGVRLWPASPLTLVDGQTKALGIAARVAADPDELPLALAELLGARYLAPGADHGPPVAAEARLEVVHADATLCFVRPDEPFTPAETARAHRLCDLAGAVVRRG